jgi:hypothetical protein
MVAASAVPHPGRRRGTPHAAVPSTARHVAGPGHELNLLELSAQHASLEQRHMELTGDAIGYRTAAGNHHVGQEFPVRQR